jgi:hypothetical protein
MTENTTLPLNVKEQVESLDSLQLVLDLKRRRG